MDTIETKIGKIFIIDGEKGKLECLSLRDYGQKANCKAAFLGLNEDINGVSDDLPLLPLSEKWVITISTQYGCQCFCRFCDVPKVNFTGNCSVSDMNRQMIAAIISETEFSPKRINIHYARMGEPTFNSEVIAHACAVPLLVDDFFKPNTFVKIHPVISTMMPRFNPGLKEFLRVWCLVKNTTYKGDAGLQLSINSTDNIQRNYLFNGQSLDLADIAAIAEKLDAPVGRKYTLNFALADGMIIDAKLLASMFDQEKFMCKITPIHNTAACRCNEIKTTGGYWNYTPYHKAESELREAGFDVLVFIPSQAEEEGKITCGNAILANN